MNDELIKVTDYGANLERGWEQANILSSIGGIVCTRECSCYCSACGEAGDTDAMICFPGY
jgi:hypothetical protein